MQPQRKVIPTHHFDQTELPWQALANAVVIQAVNDYRGFTRMLRRLRRKVAKESALSDEERACLRIRIDYYSYQLREIRSFFRSEDFALYSEADGPMLLRRLERETR